MYSVRFALQGPVVKRPISSNPGLNFNPGFFFFCSKVFSQVISSLFLEHPIIKLLAERIKLNFLLKLSYLKSNFTLTAGYLNPALNNPALVYKA